MKKFSLILICSSCLFIISACGSGSDSSIESIADSNEISAATNAATTDKAASLVDSAIFTDENFAQCITRTIAESEVDITELADITKLYCEGLGIESTDGIELLTGLYELGLNNNLISAINIANNWHLKVLNMEENQLATIDLELNPNLEYLNLNDNLLTEIDLTANTNLKGLYLKNNQLSALDISNLQLTALDVSGNNSDFYISVY